MVLILDGNSDLGDQVLDASEVNANMYCNSRTSVLGRLRDYLRLRSVHVFQIEGELTIPSNESEDILKLGSTPLDAFATSIPDLFL